MTKHGGFDYSGDLELSMVDEPEPHVLMETHAEDAALIESQAVDKGIDMAEATTTEIDLNLARPEGMEVAAPTPAKESVVSAQQGGATTPWCGDDGVR